jgi:hypothetical protein
LLENLEVKLNLFCQPYSLLVLNNNITIDVLYYCTLTNFKTNKFLLRKLKIYHSNEYQNIFINKFGASAYFARLHQIRSVATLKPNSKTGRAKRFLLQKTIFSNTASHRLLFWK